MSVDLYYYSKSNEGQNSNFLWKLEDEELCHLKHIFDQFQRKTGYKPDEYGDLILSVGALKKLLVIVNDHINTGSDKKIAESHNRFKAIIEEAVKQNKQIAFYGD